jgi:hypothetical protein
MVLALAERHTRGHVEAGRRAAARGKRLDGGPQPKLVQRGRAQLGDQRAEVLDLALRVVDRLRELLGRARTTRRRQEHAQADESLKRLVVQLASPAPACLLGGLDAVAKPLVRHGLGRREGCGR